MAEIHKKWSYIRWRLTGLRNRNCLKLNINLFKVLIMPLHRLAATAYHRLDEEIKNKVEVRIKVQFKVFCNLPTNMSDETFKLLFGGTVKETLENFNKKTVRKYLARDAQQVPLASRVLAREHRITIFKKFPRNLTEMLKIVYRSRCGGTSNRSGAKCTGQITRTTHLREEHGYHVSALNILRLYNNKHEGIARIIINQTIQFVERLRVVPGRARKN